MAELQFGRVRTCLFDPAYMNRQSTLGALQTLGFTEIEPISRLRDFESALTGSEYDLVIAELQGQEDELCDLVRRLRHRGLVRNPFVAILLTTWDLNGETVRAVINCGADDLLARPYTIAQMRQRIAGVAVNRKPFVVTADYVGPSRRTSTRAPEEDELFAVPCGLTARQGNEAHSAAVEATWNKVLRWKAIRLGRQLEATSRMLGETAFHSGNAPAIASMIERIVTVAADLKVYLDQTSDPAYAAIGRECALLGKAPKSASIEAETQRVQEAAGSSPNACAN